MTIEKTARVTWEKPPDGDVTIRAYDTAGIFGGVSLGQGSLHWIAIDASDLDDLIRHLTDIRNETKGEAT